MSYTKVDAVLAVGRKNLENQTVTTDSTAGNLTYTAAMLLGGLILRNTNGASRSDVTPTAALLLAAIKSGGVASNPAGSSYGVGGTNGVPPPNGTAFEFTIRNTAGAAETITVTAGTGFTLSGTMTIAQNNSKRFLCVLTDNRDGNAAFTLYSLGTVVH